MTHHKMCRAELRAWIDIYGDGSWSCTQCMFIAQVEATAYRQGWRAGYMEGRQAAAMDVKDELRHGPNPYIGGSRTCARCARGWPHPVDPVARAAGKPADHNRLPTSDAKGHDL